MTLSCFFRAFGIFLLLWTCDLEFLMRFVWQTVLIRAYLFRHILSHYFYWRKYLRFLFGKSTTKFRSCVFTDGKTFLFFSFAGSKNWFLIVLFIFNGWQNTFLSTGENSFLIFATNSQKWMKDIVMFCSLFMFLKNNLKCLTVTNYTIMVNLFDGPGN
jgi:hypothetical protein